ncbi:MAG TPA: Uma2 family endonuclease [Phototrophicaceae bacterium]|nr:Uma2 family endonuclease [Phototrophicaceae bacterium]
MVTREQLYTVADLWRLSHSGEYDQQRLELSEGELIVMSPAGGKHGGIAARLGRLIGNYVEAHHLGEITAAETGYILFQNADGKNTVRAPDVGFVAAERLPDGLPDEYLPFAPDLAVEVVSPNDDAEDLQLKVRQYLRYGTPLVWVVYPKSQTVVVHTPQETRTLELEDTLDGGDMLPGFTLAVKSIFPE